MRRLIPAVAALALVACQPQDPTGGAAAPPADAPEVPPVASDFSQDMTARGTEPFWMLKIEGVTFTLERMDQQTLTAQAPGAAIQPGKATWSATTDDGRPMQVTIYVSECSDGMSDLAYPMSAEVALGSETLRGCAFKTAEPPQPRPGGSPP